MNWKPGFKVNRCRKSLRLIFYVGIVLMLPQATFSWSGYGHTSMTNDALLILVKMFNEDFNKMFLNELEFNISEPDRNRIINHTDLLQCASMINSLANKSGRMLHKNEDLQKIMFTISQATHYIEDLNNPQHCSGYERGYHEDFEWIAVKGYWTDKSYDGFHYIKDYKIFAENTCRFSRRYLKYTYELYRKYNEDLYRKVITPLWAHAVNDILDLWLTILWNGFGERDYKAYGLPEPIGIRDSEKVNYERLRELE